MANIGAERGDKQRQPSADRAQEIPAIWWAVGLTSSSSHVSGQKRLFSFLAGSLERHRKGKAGAKQKQRRGVGEGIAGEEGEAALGQGRGRFAAEASGKPVAFCRQTGVCLPPSPQRYKFRAARAALSRPRLGQAAYGFFLNKLSFNTHKRDDLTEGERLNFCERHPP